MASALLCLLVAGDAKTAGLILWVTPLLLALAFCLYFIALSPSIWWKIGAFASGNLAMLFLAYLEPSGPTPASASAALLLGAGAISAPATAMIDKSPRLIVVILAWATTTVTTLAATRNETSVIAVAFIVAVGWGVMAVMGYWLMLSVERALHRIQRLGRAHHDERVASETEAQRRHGARLLHDTVLATLTLLAHSGVGVSESALRSQAGEDARLLRQLRLGGTPMPRSSGGYTLEATETSDLGHTLESVRQRFERMGLNVSWHGAGRVLLQSDVLEAFLLSLSECLENVRRHSGVGAADVTITQDETMVRAMVTDAGVGFDPDAVGAERLGLSESVIARMRDVGGRSRIFSAPGSGTTVILEAPK